MILQISDNNSIILRNFIEANYRNEKYVTIDLYLMLENGHLFIIPNSGGGLKIKEYKHKINRVVKEDRAVSLKRKPKKYEGICIDLNLEEELNKEAT